MARGADPPARRGPFPPPTTAERVLVAAGVAAALVPVVVAAARAGVRGWIPIGDNAFFTIRAHDVFTRHVPLLGTWTSASLSVGEAVNNPGPLLFYELALPVRLLGPDLGTAVGVALLNGVSLLVAAVVAWRRAGPLGAALATAVGAGLAWSMGSELLFEPWQPHSLLLPAYATLVVGWAVTAGDLRLLPLLVPAASFLLQTHLTYVYLVAALLALAIGGVTWAARRGGVPWRGPVGASVALGVVCWAPALWEQVRAGSEGNLGRLLGAVGSREGASAGMVNALRLWAAVGGRLPLWVRHSFRDALGWDPLAGRGPTGVGGAVTGLPSLRHALVAVGVTATVLGLLGLLAARRRDRVALAGVAVAAAAVGAGLVTVASIPEGVLGIAPHQLRYLWPVTAFSAAAAGVALTRSVGLDRRVPRRTVAVAGTVGLTVVVAAATLPTYEVRSGPSLDAWAIPVVADLNRQLERASLPPGPLLFETRTLRFAEPYSTPIMATLQQRGIEFVVDEEGWVRQLGRDRRFLGDNATARIGYRLGSAALVPPPGGRIVAAHRALGPAAQRERGRLAAAVSRFLEAGRLRLSRRGALLVRRGQFGTLVPLVNGPAPLPAGRVLASGELLRAVPAGALDLPPRWERRFRRWAALEERFAFRTVGVYVAPLVSGDGAGVARATR
jgi:hypothetical protein